MDNNLEVVRWESKSCQTIWTGKNEKDALVVASFAFGKEVVSAQCLEKGLLNPWEQVLDMSYTGKIKARFTVLESIDTRSEAGGKKPRIIASFGDESIEIFQRVHFD